MFLDLIIVLGTATFVATIFHSVKLPPIMGFLISGILVGPFGLALVDSPVDVQTVTEIAAFLLMFTIGLEFSFKRLKDYQRALLTIGLSQVVFTVVIISLLVHSVLEMNWDKSVFIGFLISLSSTATVLKLLQDNRDIQTSYGQTSLSILLFQDLAVIPMIIALPFLSAQHTANSLPTELGFLVLKFLGTIIAVWVFSRYIIPQILNRVVKTGSREIFFFCILFICAGTAYLMDIAGLSVTLGAFIAGIMISESPYGKQATSDFMPLRDNFLGLFFVSIGMLLDIGFVIENFSSVLATGSAILIIKAVIIASVIWFFGSPGTLSTVTGLMLCQIGEFSFILAEQGLGLGLMTAEERQYFLSMSVVSLALTPLFYRLAPRIGLASQYQQIIPKQFAKFAETVRSRVLNSLSDPIDYEKFSGREEKTIKGHAIIIGFGIAGQNVARSLKELGIPYQIIETNSETVRTYSKNEPIFFGDATNQGILERANIAYARLVVITAPGQQILQALLRAVHRDRPDIKVIVRAQYFRELKFLQINERTEVVLGELETTLEILVHVLREYGVDQQIISQLVESSRQTIQEFTQQKFSISRRKIELPRWEVFSNLRPIVLKLKDNAVGKSLIELNLRQISGATVASVYRDSCGTTHPDAEFVFESEDVLYLLGSSEQLNLAEAYIRGITPSVTESISPQT